MLRIGRCREGGVKELKKGVVRCVMGESTGKTGNWERGVSEGERQET